MKRILLLIVAVSVLSNLYSKSITDSLIFQLAGTTNDTNRVNILNQITREFRINDPGKALEFNKRAFQLAEELDYTNGIARSYDLLGTIYRYQGDYTRSLDNYLKSIKLYFELNDSTNIADLYNNIGLVYRETNEIEKAIDYHLKAFKIFVSIKDYEGLAIISNNLGVSFRSLKNDSLALHYYQKAYDMNEKINRRSGMELARMNIGNCYLTKKQYQKAKSIYKKSEEYYKNMNDPNKLAMAIYNIGNVNIYLGQFDSARLSLLESYELANTYSLFEQKKMSLWGLIRLSKLQNRYRESTAYLEEYIGIQDHFLNETLNNKILELERKIEFEKALKDQELELVKKSKKLKVNTLQKYILLIILFSVSLIAWILINRKVIKIKYFNEKLRLKDNELMGYAMYILQKNDLINDFREQLLKLHKRLKVDDNKKAVNEIVNSLIFKIAISKDIEKFRDKLREISDEFYLKLDRKFPNLTNKEKQLVTLIRLGLTTKQIGVILGNTTESVEKSRSRLRKKMGLSQDYNLKDIISQI